MESSELLFVIFTPHLNPLPKGEERPTHRFFPSPLSISVVSTKDCEERDRVR
jgi:hypothetical protein